MLIPGTGAIYTLSAGMSRGTRASAIAAVGCTLGIVPHILAAVTGLAAILHASAVAFQTLKYIGVLYLLYMAVMMWQQDGALIHAHGSAPQSASRVIARGILINLLNPKLTIFFFAFLPQFVPARHPHPLPTMLGLSGVFMAVTFVIFCGYGACAAAIRERILARPRAMRWIQRSFAASFALLGLRLALAED